MKMVQICHLFFLQTDVHVLKIMPCLSFVLNHQPAAATIQKKSSSPSPFSSSSATSVT